MTESGSPKRARATTMNLTGGGHAWLVALTGPQLGRRYPLRQGKTVIGRSSAVAVAIDDDAVSRQHAFVLHDDQGVCVVYDLNSSNGTLVNGERVSETGLHSGDRIQVGSHVLLFTRRSTAHQQLMQQQRFEAVGRVAAGAVHDFNNMLGVVIANADYVHAALPNEELSPEQVLACLEDIRTSARRAHAVTRRLLDLSTTQGAAFRDVDVSQLCTDTCRLLRGVIAKTIEVECEAADSLQLLGDYAELHQVIVNLMLNAADAMPHGGQLRVRSYRPDAESVAILVSDTGAGMDTETASRVFEPFFTTKERGYGLGLATVREIVSAHGGSIEVSSEVGRGTTFQVVLPSRGRIPRSMTTPPPSDTYRDRSDALLLVVDDEPSVRRVTARVLERAGYRVVQAQDGRDGIRRYLTCDERPDLVLLDLDMPVLDGRQTLALMRKLDPQVRVMICSGVSDAEQQQARELGAVATLSKPAGAREIVNTVDAALRLAEDQSPADDATVDTLSPMSD